MRKVILITSGLLLATMLQAQSWQLKPWQKFLIDEQVKRDTTSTCRSVMGNAVAPMPYDRRLFHTVTGSGFIKDPPPYKKKPKSFFGGNDTSERMARGDYHTSDFLADMVCDIIDIFILKSK